jgi:2-furoyl-CoA dehydrogenase large subunit
LTNKTPEEAVRGFGQAPTNFALERTIDSVARHLNMDPIELRRRNLIRKDEFPYLIRSGSTYDSGDYHAVLDKALKAIDHPALLIERDSARRAGKLAGIGISTCLEPNGGNSGFEPLLNPKNDTTTWMDSCLVRVDLSGAITGVLGTSSSGKFSNGIPLISASFVPTRCRRCRPTVRWAAAWRSCLAVPQPARPAKSKRR